MCRLAGFIANKPPVDWHRRLAKMLLAGESGGSHATGVFLFDGKRTITLKAALPASRFIKSKEFLKLAKQKPLVCLAHTRFATQGKPEINTNNHPLTAGNWTIIHNGVLDNDKVLRTIYGLPQQPEVDSFVIAALLDKADRLFPQLEPNKKCDWVMSKLSGSYVCVAFHRPTVSTWVFKNKDAYFTKKEKGTTWFGSTEQIIAGKLPLPVKVESFPRLNWTDFTPYGQGKFIFE